jgi:hypothetical protein
LLFAASFLIGQQLMVYVFKRENKPVSDVEVLTLICGHCDGNWRPTRSLSVLRVGVADFPARTMGQVDAESAF